MHFSHVQWEHKLFKTVTSSWSKIIITGLKEGSQNIFIKVNEIYLKQLMMSKQNLAFMLLGCRKWSMVGCLSYQISFIW